MSHYYPNHKLKFWQSKGLGGHLATISDAEVNAFVNSKINDLAGSDPVCVLLFISSHDFWKHQIVQWISGFFD